MTVLDEIAKNELLLIGNEVYRLVGDYRDVKTPLSFELVHVENSDDEMMVTEKQMESNLKSGKWKRVEMHK